MNSSAKKMRWSGPRPDIPKIGDFKISAMYSVPRSPISQDLARKQFTTMPYFPILSNASLTKSTT